MALSDFLRIHRTEILARCRARVASRMAPRPTEFELEHGIPLFLDQLTAILHTKLTVGGAIGASATKHGSELLCLGFTVGQVVHDYGDVCQSITGLAIEMRAPITTEEFKALNLCLDDAIADAVTEYGRQREVNVEARGTAELGAFSHELRNLIGAASLACAALREGTVGISGSTGKLLEHSLANLRNLVDRSQTVVRLDSGTGVNGRLTVRELIEDVELSAIMAAKAAGHELTVEIATPEAVVLADRQVLAAIIANLLQNAFKFTRHRGHVCLRSSATQNRVRFEIEDECGGLPPGKVDLLFKPFERRGANLTGLGLGLAICLRGVHAIGGAITVRDLPNKGCVFTVEIPRVVVTP